MGLNIIQKIYREIRARNIIKAARMIPFISFVVAPKFSKYSAVRILLTFTIFVPFVGIFRRNYIKNKYAKYLESKIEQKEIQLKDMLNKFQIKIDGEKQYMVVINLGEKGEGAMQDQGEEGNIGEEEKENSRKVFNLMEQVQQSKQAKIVKWAFIGSKKLYELIQISREKGRRKGEIFDLQLYQNQKLNRQAKVYLIAREEEGDKVIMDWPIGVPYNQIAKYIARHKYKKYLKQVNF